MGRNQEFRTYLFKLFFHYFGNKDLFSKLKSGEAVLMNEEELAFFYDSFTQVDDEHPENSVDPDLKIVAESMVRSAFKNFQERTLLIEQASRKKISQIASVELSVLFMALEESILMKETPKKVIINEAINITKEYSTKE